MIWLRNITGEYNRWTGLLDWTTGLDYWTGLLDWTAGMDYWTALLTILTRLAVYASVHKSWPRAERAHMGVVNNA